MTALINPFDLPGKWYKANLHTHTTTSDGQLPPQERIDQYHAGNYDVLALTDHGRTNDIAALDGHGMLLVSGMEMHPLCPTHPNKYHIVALNVPYGFAPSDAQDAQKSINEVNAAGGLASFAHPFWTGHRLEDFSNLQGLSAMEVFNSTCERIGRGSSENEWTNALDRGWMIPCLGVDDVHQKDLDCPRGKMAGHEIFQTWTWLRMQSPTVQNVLGAIRTGACYASRGPKISYFGIQDGMVKIDCSAAKDIYFMGGPIEGEHVVAQGRSSLRHHEMPIKPWRYVRAVVADAHGKRAWTNPIMLK
jgi:hypothetical protein